MPLPRGDSHRTTVACPPTYHPCRWIMFCLGSHLPATCLPLPPFACHYAILPAYSIFTHCAHCLTATHCPRTHTPRRLFTARHLGFAVARALVALGSRIFCVCAAAGPNDVTYLTLLWTDRLPCPHTAAHPHPTPTPPPSPTRRGGHLTPPITPPAGDGLALPRCGAPLCRGGGLVAHPWTSTADFLWTTCARSIGAA